jgi:hypothetical protein
VARIDLVTAHLLRGELDAAEEAVRPVLALPPEQRTTIVVKRVDDLERRLSQDRYLGAPEAERLGAGIEDFRAATALLQLPAG